MVVVDSSVWISCLRGENSLLIEKLSRLLDEAKVALAVPIWIELLSGASKADKSRLKRVLSALPLYYPSLETWRRMEGWIDASTAAGQRFGFSDLLIASITVEHGAMLWALDSDFERMEKLKFLKAYCPSKENPHS